MEPTRFRIWNYRSIDDSGDCYLSPNITVLAGRNEAGKSSIVEALGSFSEGEDIPENAKPISGTGEPKIEIEYSITTNEKKDIIPPNFDEDLIAADGEITIRKSFPNEYEIVSDVDRLFPEIDTQLENLLADINDHFGWSGKNREQVLDMLNEMHQEKRESKEAIQDELNSLQNKLDNSEDLSDAARSNIKAKLSNLEEDLTKAQREQSAIEEEQNNLQKYNNVDIKGTIKQNILDLMPDYVLFEHSGDLIPNTVNVDKLGNHQFVEDLHAISEFDPDIVQTGGNREKQTHRTQVNMSLNEEYSQFWTQDASSLSVDWNSQELEFWIEDDNRYFAPSERSHGRQWHLSFYIRVTAHANRNNPPVVLIDDLGIHLHEEAQKDILNRLEDLSDDCKVIFTTHSPYLIDPNHLNRIRLVEKTDENGTNINKIHADAEKETLSPILDAVGAAPELGIRADKENSIVVEGISDYYYIQSFREILGSDQELNIIPGVGDTTQVYIGAILIGWGVNPIFCLDGDDAHNIKDDLKDDLYIDEDNIIYVHNRGAIEDVFTKDDFVQYVLRDPDREFESDLNSEFMGRSKYSKALTSKLFYEYVLEEGDTMDLDQESLDNMVRILDDIGDARSN